MNACSDTLDPELPDLSKGESAVLSVDLNALGDNYALLASFAKGAECAAVVKANAYGTGIDHVAPALLARGCRTFFVALLAEGAELRAIAPNASIYVLNGYSRGSNEIYRRYQLKPVLGSLKQIEDWAADNRTAGELPAAALHVDTGMNRLGIGFDEINTLATNQKRYLGSIRLDLVMSHLACADEPHNPLNQRQLKLFRSVLSELPKVRVSLANSAGILLGANYHFDLVRPGIALYGGHPANAGPNPMQNVVRLASRIAQLRHVKSGDTIGYGAGHTASRLLRVATIPVGYADGYLRALGASDGRSGATVTIQGHRAPLIGRVSMDLITVDVTDLPEGLAVPGTAVEVIGDTSLEDLAQTAGTINYEILTSLGRRFRRRYVGN